ncbi:unnamed protein product [Blepharisma stoltei]|uniref:Calcineurin-like phosphoesterase domain-containing protein n=1 Tax=Blepharisma stoltei TaxID=1481888 RepID=A0AAU9JZA8_9CILI|nr:unnamed protein product [Blepharisma stoltei]
MSAKEVWVLLSIYSLIVAAFIVVIVSSASSQSKTTKLEKFELVAGQPLRFHLLGDFGELDPYEKIYNEYPVQVVAQRMVANAYVRPISMIITTGDNRYPKPDSKFDQVIYKYLYHIFNKGGLQSKPWFLVLGNHDCSSNPQYEIDATSLYPMWHLPRKFYNFTIEIDNKYLAAFIFMNGCSLAHDINKVGDLEQYEWLEKILKDLNRNPRVKWILVNIHEPPFSAGIHHGDNEPIKKFILPLLFKYNVDILMTGHEHNMQYFISRYSNDTMPPYEPLPNSTFNCSKEEFVPYNRESFWIKGQGLHEIVQGAGGAELYELCPNKTTEMADLVYGNVQFGFSEVYIDSTMISVDYYAIDEGDPVYSLKIYAK